MFKKKYSVSLLNQKWEQIRGNLELEHIPRKDEIIYLEDKKLYFDVINVVHYLNKKQGIFVIIKESLHQGYPS